MTLLAEDQPMAHKSHACNACRGTISAGERYLRQRNADYSEVWTYKSHLLCDHIVSHLSEPLFSDESIDPGEVQDELRRYLAVLA